MQLEQFGFDVRRSVSDSVEGAVERDGPGVRSVDRPKYAGAM
jgi:hypothetical protein